MFACPKTDLEAHIEAHLEAHLGALHISTRRCVRSTQPQRRPTLPSGADDDAFDLFLQKQIFWLHESMKKVKDSARNWHK